MNPRVPTKDQCVVISNVVQGKAGIYFSCPLRFSPNTSTFMNHFTKNMRDFPIRVAVRESIKTTNMKLNGEIPPFTLSQLIGKRYYEKKLEYENRIKKSTSYFDLTLCE
jgi:hypothetical protein